MCKEVIYMEDTNINETDLNSSETTESSKKKWKQYSYLIIIVTIFYTIAITTWLIYDNIFFLVNFGIIGTCLGIAGGLSVYLPRKKRHIARRLSQFMVGGYLFFGIGFGIFTLGSGYLKPENMQFEGFWFWLLAGSYTAVVLHYFIAKIFGPLLFNRGWCGWACWTAAILDLLPWRKSPGRKKGLGYLRLVVFATSTVLVFVLVFVFDYTRNTTVGIFPVGSVPAEVLDRQYSSFFAIPEFLWFISGNLVYYVLGIGLAFVLKDNRAFCKYICPISISMKVTSRASIGKMEVDNEKCIRCGACERACPMDIKILEFAEQNKRVLSTECIYCFDCVNVCPKSAISVTNNFDFGVKDLLYGYGEKKIKRSVRIKSE